MATALLSKQKHTRTPVNMRRVSPISSIHTLQLCTRDTVVVLDISAGTGTIARNE